MEQENRGKEEKRDKVEDEYDPFKNRKVAQPNGDFGAFMHLIKSAFGAGVLGMPKAYKESGIWLGLFLNLIIAGICCHCCYILVQISRRQSVISKVPQLDYAQTVEHTFKNGPKKWMKKISPAIKIAVNICICLTYYSLCSVYITYISNQTQQLIECKANEETPSFHMHIGVYTAMYLPLFLLVGQVRDLRHLIPFSSIANFLTFIGLAIVMVFVFKDGLPPISSVDYVGTLSGLPIFVSIVIFSLENIGVVLPLENNMAHPEHYLGFRGILIWSMIIIVSIYCIVGFFGYWRYGEAIADSITLSLPMTEKAALAMKSCILIAVIFSYGLNFFIPTEIVWELVEKKIRDRVSDKWVIFVEHALRSLFVLLTVFISLCIPRISVIMTFVGALFFSTLGLFWPAILDVLTYWNPGTHGHNLRIVKNVSILIFYFVVVASGTYDGMLQLANQEPEAVCPVVNPEHNTTISY